MADDGDLQHIEAVIMASIIVAIGSYAFPSGAEQYSTVTKVRHTHAHTHTRAN